ncbi:S-methyl-5-thioribose kinase [Cellulomonas fengjieae]|uniref:S-methyl-5-thioribose kinase n=1 Tax=Cellulomonas fengjieae TaxID=2819978 RepID=UPI001AAE3EDD|nr:S-methyl-5-thioribose kinase [Cellulomonas fengjieae]MBO3102182.1 S-methyl-5-thioribose kinase [Cellulomonas fengjieae]
MTTHEYEFLTTETVADYVRSRPVLSGRVDPDHLVRVDEIGDGNLNLVFVLEDGRGRRLVLKQALPYVRMVGAGWPMTPERARREADSLRTHRALAGELVVETIEYDPQQYVIAMEDLSDHAVWRHALNRGERHDGAAAALGRYVAAVAFGTSVLGMERDAAAQALARSVNPDLCTITEDLVFTEPSVDAGRNEVLAANEPDAKALAADETFVAAMGVAKWKFMTQAEALIHGDLHTGSVFVRAAESSTECDSVKVFDSEFAFYGPVAFDLGATFANYVFAAARAYAQGDDDRAEWALSLPGQTWDAFAAEFRARFEGVRDGRVWGQAFRETLLDRWLRETWLFAAAKMARRIVGAAKVKDVETLPEALREGAARGVLLAAREAASAWDAPHRPEDFAALAGALLREHRTS